MPQTYERVVGKRIGRNPYVGRRQSLSWGGTVRAAQPQRRFTAGMDIELAEQLRGVMLDHLRGHDKLWRTHAYSETAFSRGARRARRAGPAWHAPPAGRTAAGTMLVPLSLSQTAVASPCESTSGCPPTRPLTGQRKPATPAPPKPNLAPAARNPSSRARGDIPAATARPAAVSRRLVTSSMGLPCSCVNRVTRRSRGPAPAPG